MMDTRSNNATTVVFSQFVVWALALAGVAHPTSSTADCVSQACAVVGGGVPSSAAPLPPAPAPAPSCVSTTTVVFSAGPPSPFRVRHTELRRV
jgi:hypothetical protein